MGAEGTEGIGPSEKDIQGSDPKDKTTGNRHSKENAKGRHPTARNREDESPPPEPVDIGHPNPTIARLIAQAEAEQSALDGEDPAVDMLTQEEVDRRIADLEKLFVEQESQEEIDKAEKYQAAVNTEKEKLTSLFDDENYPHRNASIDEAIEKFRENPESLGFEDLMAILEGESKDITAMLESLGENINPHTYYLLSSRLARFDEIKKVLERMLDGKKIEGKDENLDLYLSTNINHFKEVKSTDDLEVFEAFYEKYSGYKPAKKKKKG